MKIRYLLLTIFFLGLLTLVVEATPKIIVSDKDKSILQEKLDKFSKDIILPSGELMLKIGLDFKGTPYVAKTLDINTEESLIVNLRELDCTTFVENCLAIVQTIKSGHPNFETFLSMLEKIRYRKGHLNGYTSRLHYFSEWVKDNEVKGFVTDVTSRLGGIKFPLSLNFMGTHPNLYPQLKGNTELINKIREIEKSVSEKQFYYIPKEVIGNEEDKMVGGDIIALTTKIVGLDVSHLGLVYKNNGETFLLNASSLGGKVEITPVSLTQYLNKSKSTIGIFVIRVN